MQQPAIRRFAGMAAVALGAVGVAGCLGDPAGVEPNDNDVVGVAIQLSAQFLMVSEMSETSQTDTIQGLAATIHDHHTAHVEAFDGIGITPRGNDITVFLFNQTSGIQTQLQFTPEEDFDEEYLNILAGIHGQAILFIDEELLTIVQDPDLELEVRALRATIEADLVAVEVMQVELGFDVEPT